MQSFKVILATHNCRLNLKTAEIRVVVSLYLKRYFNLMSL